MAKTPYFGSNDLTTLLLKIKDHLTSFYVKKELKTGSTTQNKVLSDNNLTDDLVAKINKAGESNFSGNYNDLTNKPTIPTKVGDLSNDAGYISEHQDISGKLNNNGDASNLTTTFTASAARANLSSGEKMSVTFGKLMKWFSDMKTVAFTGAYSDLTGKPTIPSKVSELENDSSFAKTEAIPTKVGDLKNDKSYQTATQVQSSITTALTGIATENYVDGKISDLIGEGTPDTLDTLKEIADALTKSDSDVAALTLVVSKKLNADDLSEFTADEISEIWDSVFTS